MTQSHEIGAISSIDGVHRKRKTIQTSIDDPHGEVLSYLNKLLDDWSEGEIFHLFTASYEFDCGYITIASHGNTNNPEYPCYYEPHIYGYLDKFYFCFDNWLWIKTKLLGNLKSFQNRGFFAKRFIGEKDNQLTPEEGFELSGYSNEIINLISLFKDREDLVKNYEQKRGV